MIATGDGPITVTRSGAEEEAESLAVVTTGGARALLHGKEELGLESRDLTLRGTTRTQTRGDQRVRSFTPSEVLAEGEVFAHHAAAEMTGGQAKLSFDIAGEPRELAGLGASQARRRGRRRARERRRAGAALVGARGRRTADRRRLARRRRSELQLARTGDLDGARQRLASRSLREHHRPTAPRSTRRSAAARSGSRHADGPRVHRRRPQARRRGGRHRLAARARFDVRAGATHGAR